MPFVVLGGGSGTGGGIVIPNDLRFATTTARDSYFTNNPTRLTDEIIVLVTTAPTTQQLFQYRKSESRWIEITAAIVGSTGNAGKDGNNSIPQYSANGIDWFPETNINVNPKYIRFSSDNGKTWTLGFKIVADQVVYQYSVDGKNGWSSVLDSTHKFAKISVDEGLSYSSSFRLVADHIVYEYSQTNQGPWEPSFIKEKHFWGRVSIDSGKTFADPFRFVAHDGLSFFAQYAASELGPWSDVFIDGVHEFVHFSTDGQSTWTPAQRFKALAFGMNADDRNVIDVGGHKIISNNENIAFRNIFTGDSFYPVWQGISADGSTLYRASEVVFGAKTSNEINGSVGANKVDFNFIRTYPTRAAITKMVFRPAETYSGDIKFQIWSPNGLTLIYSQTVKNASLIDGKDFTIGYQGNLFVQPGNTLNVRVVRGDGKAIKAYSGTDVVTEPWRTFDYFPMESIQLLNKQSSSDIARMMESLIGSERLSINALKDIDNIKVGSLRGDINFIKDLSQFIPATKNDYWKSDREISYGGLMFKTGDKLIAMRNIDASETLTNLVDPSTFYVERNLANVAKRDELGIVMPGDNIEIATNGEIRVRPATLDNDGAVKLGAPNGAAKLNADGKVPLEQLPALDTLRRLSVANENAKLAITKSTVFTIAIQIDTQDQWYLDANLLPSIKSNWVYGGSVATTVTGFNKRTGNVVPEAGDYTADMVNAIPKPKTNDGKRRVVIGDKLIEEELKPDEITDSTTGIKYVLKIESGVPYLETVV